MKLACPWRPYFWLISAMTPAMAGDEAEVPPTRKTCGSVEVVAEQSPGLAQMGHALKLTPLAANRDTSGRSRAWSLGTPGAFCQEGLVYPDRQVAVSTEEEVVASEQLLTPPPPAALGMEKPFAGLKGIALKPRSLSQGCSGNWALREPSEASLLGFQRVAMLGAPVA